MSNMIRDGKKPLSAKASARPAPIRPDDVFGNPLGLDPSLVKELEAKGLAFRFINFAKLKELGGYHPQGWKPYKCDTLGKTTSDFLFGSDSDGYLRRGDCILAVRSKELNDKHKAFLQQETESRARAQRTQAEELRRFTKEAGVDLKIHEGYEDEE